MKRDGGRLLHRLRLAATTRDRNTWRCSSTRIAEICLLCPAPSVIKRDAHNCPFAFTHLGLTSVTDKHRLSSHDFLLGRV